ncbi:MAG: EAL domain-containing protein [Rhodocyclaceae bacterium]|nr:MAG: EAL domain-containing protein [Rhodocyclaceae bacterium]
MLRQAKAIVLPLLILVAGLAASEFTARFEEQRLNADQHEQTLAAAAGMRASLESELNATLHLASGLAAYIQASGGATRAEKIRPILAALIDQSPYLRNVGLAPDNRLSYVEPVHGNEKVIGLYYPNLKAQWPAIERAIRSRQPTLAGPVALIQGGSGLIYRLPIFLNDGRYWGLISTVIDADRLLAGVSGLAQDRGLSIALRGKDGLGAEGEVFRGTSQQFGKSAVVMDVAVSGGHWQLALSPLVPASTGTRPLIVRLAGSTLAFLLSFLLWRTNRAYREQHALTAQLRTQHEKLHGLYELSPLGIALMDDKGRYLEANGAFSRITGYTQEELKSLTFHDITPTEYHDLNDELLGALFRHGRYGPNEKAYIRKDQSRVPVQISGALISAENGGRYIGVIVEDIRQRKEAESRINLLAFYDPLTGLPNRRLFIDRLGHALAASSRSFQFGALLLIDLDHFKTLNDTRGHDIGDHLLKEVSKRLERTVRAGDTVARLGGDEFMVMLEDLGEEEAGAANQADTVAEKILDILSLPYDIAGDAPANHHGTASIGISLFQGQGATVETLLKQADVALYQAKDAGRNAVRFYNGDMQAALEMRAEMEHGLHQALAQDEFQLHYQPQIDRQRGLVGAEALLRWRPVGGDKLIPPDQFIPVAEETGLILPIGQWVLEQACIQLRAWQASPLTTRLQLAVNVSPRQFRQADFASQVQQILERYHVQPAQLKLELTESLVLDDVDDAIRKMETLRALGVSFALDDFGTGYSSLSYLRRLPIDQLKIDRSFVRDIANGEDDSDAIILAIISMSHSLKLQVVAEGVETAEQRAFLAGNGCDLFQGFLFGRPMPQEDFEDLLAKPIAA